MSATDDPNEIPSEYLPPEELWPAGNSPILGFHTAAQIQTMVDQPDVSHFDTPKKQAEWRRLHTRIADSKLARAELLKQPLVQALRTLREAHDRLFDAVANPMDDLEKMELHSTKLGEKIDTGAWSWLDTIQENYKEAAYRFVIEAGAPPSKAREYMDHMYNHVVHYGLDATDLDRSDPSQNEEHKALREECWQAPMGHRMYGELARTDLATEQKRPSRRKRTPAIPPSDTKGQPQFAGSEAQLAIPDLKQAHADLFFSTVESLLTRKKMDSDAHTLARAAFHQAANDFWILDSTIRHDRQDTVDWVKHLTLRAQVLTEQHAMKACGGVGGFARINNIDSEVCKLACEKSWNALCSNNLGFLGDISKLASPAR